MQLPDHRCSSVSHDCSIRNAGLQRLAYLTNTTNEHIPEMALSITLQPSHFACDGHVSNLGLPVACKSLWDAARSDREPLVSRRIPRNSTTAVLQGCGWLRLYRAKTPRQWTAAIRCHRTATCSTTRLSLPRRRTMQVAIRGHTKVSTLAVESRL